MGQSEAGGSLQVDFLEELSWQWGVYVWGEQLAIRNIRVEKKGT